MTILLILGGHILNMKEKQMQHDNDNDINNKTDSPLTLALIGQSLVSHSSQAWIIKHGECDEDWCVINR